MAAQISGCTLEGLGKLKKNAENSYQYLLIRLLLGTATVSRGSNRRKQKIDYSTLPSTLQLKTPKLAVEDFLASYSVGGNVARFLKVTTSDNREFYKNILCEFMNFELQSAQKRHTAAFIFLYRLLEQISYSIPLLYASAQSDYHGTFKDLQSILSAESKTELGLFKKLLNGGQFIDTLTLQLRQKISFATGNSNGVAYYKLTTKRFKLFTSMNPNIQEVEIHFSDIPEFLITIRNRFFHGLIGDSSKDNVKAVEMPNSDEYFERINPIIISFLAVVILQTFPAKYQC